MIDFSLIETLRYEPDIGFVRLNFHLMRLAHSAALIGFPNTDRAAASLTEAVANASEPLRVRLTFNAQGRIDVTTTLFAPHSHDILWNVRIAKTRLASDDRLLRMKTTRRGIYEQARAEYTPQQADEVIILNERGEVCEGTITSIFVDDGSEVLRTPPISCGLLAGVLRADLICQRKARVTRITLADLDHGKLYLGNSLRGLIRADLKR